MDFHVITQICVGTCNSACVDVCPVDCIAGPIPMSELRAVPAAERGAHFPELQLYIDPEQCICCGMCAPECPVQAIFDVNDVPAEYQDDIEANARFFDTG